MQQEPKDEWTEALGRIVQGFTHELNNRLLALMGVRDLLEEPDAPDAELLRLFDGELERLGESNRRLRQLVTRDDEPETLPAGDLLTAIRSLHDRHSGLQGVRVWWTSEDPLPAVRVLPSDFIRGSLLLLAAACASARQNEGGVRVTVEAGPPLIVRVAPSPERIRAAAGLLEAAGARLEVEADACRIEAPCVG